MFALIAKNLVRGNIGRQWMAIRDMDIAAELMGIRPLYAKLSAFAVSSFILGVAGALWAFVYLGSWEPLAFSIDRSLQLLFMVIIGGLGSILGSFLGAAFILILPIMLNLIPHALGVPLSTATITHLEFIIFGSLICYLLIKEPHGFARLWTIGEGEAEALAVPVLRRRLRIAAGAMRSGSGADVEDCTQMTIRALKAVQEGGNVDDEHDRLDWRQPRRPPLRQLPAAASRTSSSFPCCPTARAPMP